MTRTNLRTQVALWLLLPLLGLLALDSWLTYQRAMSAAHVAFDRTLSSSLKSIREGVRLNDGEIEVDLPYLALEMLESSDGGKVYYLIREDNGHTITGYPDLPLPHGRDAGDGALFVTRYYDVVYRGEQLRMAALRIPVHDVPTAQSRIVWVMVGETIEARQALAREILVGSLLQEGLLVVLALGIVWLGVGRGLRPLNRLSATVAARSEDDTTPLDTGAVPSELAPLVESINQYIGRTQRMQVARAVAHAPEQLAVETSGEQRAGEGRRPVRERGRERPFAASVRAVACRAVLCIQVRAAHHVRYRKRHGIALETRRHGGREPQRRRRARREPRNRQRGERGRDTPFARHKCDAREHDGQRRRRHGECELPRESRVDAQRFERDAMGPRPRGLTVGVARQPDRMQHARQRDLRAIQPLQKQERPVGERRRVHRLRPRRAATLRRTAPCIYQLASSPRCRSASWRNSARRGSPRWRG